MIFAVSVFVGANPIFKFSNDFVSIYVKNVDVPNGSEKTIKKTSNVTATHVPDIQSSHAVNSLNNDATAIC